MSEIAIDKDLAGYAQFLHMPMTFHSLVLENTNRCTARCPICYQSAGPKGSDVSGPASLTVEEQERVIRESVDIPALLPRFHLSGGEAFLDLEACLHLFRVAGDCGFLDITSVTNAFWARRRSRAFQIVRRARDAGLTTLEVSWDAWHRGFVPAEAIDNCIEACHAHGVEANLRVLTSRSHSVAEALSYLLPESVEKAGRITSGPVFASGRAVRELDSQEFYVSRTSLDGTCHSNLNLVVNCHGNVYPCCAGLDQTKYYVTGSIRQQPVADIAEAMSGSPLLRMIAFRGIATLAGIVEGRGVEVGRDYNSICHMCWSFFSRRECVEAASDHFVESCQRALKSVIRQLEEQGLTAAEEARA